MPDHGTHTELLVQRLNLEHPGERRLRHFVVFDDTQDAVSRRSDVDDLACLDLHGVGGFSEVCAVTEMQAVAEHAAEGTR